MKNVVKVYFIGGWFGTGKTTLLLAAGQILQRRRQTVGLVTPHSLPDIPAVKRFPKCRDCHYAAQPDFFFQDPAALLACLKRFAFDEKGKATRDVLFVELPGNFDDSVENLIKRMKAAEEIPPFDWGVYPVLIDPKRAQSLFNTPKENAAESATITRQLENSETIILNKSDTLLEERDRKALLLKLAIKFPKAETMLAKKRVCVEDYLQNDRFHSNHHRSFSGMKGIGVENWLREIGAF